MGLSGLSQLWLENCKFTAESLLKNLASETQASLEVGQDSVHLVFSVSFQLQLLSWTPESWILQGGRSLLPQRRGGTGRGSARILLCKLLPVPGHWTVGPAHSSCVGPQPPGHTCTHALHMQYIYTLAIPSRPAQQISCWLWTDSCFLKFKGGQLPFFCFKEVKAICTIHLDRTTLSSLYFLCCIWLFLSYVTLLTVKTEWLGTTYFLAYATLQFVHTNWNLLPRVLPSQKPQQTHNALYHVYPRLFLSSYYCQLRSTKVTYILLHIYNIYISKVKCLYSVFAFLRIWQCLCIHTVYIYIYSI